MRVISTNRLQPGDKLAKPVYGTAGGLIMPANLPLTREHIERLLKQGVQQVYLDDPRVADLQIEEPIREITRIKVIKVLQEAMQEIGKKGLAVSLNSKAIEEVIHELHEELIYGRAREINLYKVQAGEDYLPLQALNTAILATNMARLGGFVQNSKDVVTGTLLMNLGLALIPKEILFKPGALLPEEKIQVQKHVEYSLQIANNNFPNLRAHVKVIIQQHHERLDGSGYPQGLKGEKIHPLAQLVGIAETYSAMVSWRPYREIISPQEAIEYIMGGAGIEFDHKLIDIFSRCTVPYPVGSMVLLSTGEKGVIIDLGKGLATRPRIRLFTDEKGQNLAQPVDINLSDPQYQTRVIVGLLDE
ncbi:HD domain-containing protein [Carboxydocella sporoproducens DSM 16521]|uniref:HD domain-containing protein n=2 Tax=Carboxydocella TaxID=178898 RepID=A0A1T4QK21_9FIRM|nr:MULTISPECIES: HD domain-containing phosphohydrolase [Carboxydocella]AVX19257.1 HD domain-containing protein [Carboxydocella thermautotrophica]SKA03831.1 HD domain-containing protein [Carboxydocella sporoproducens DSM 16521]